jgi:hypothetical protein
VNSGMKGIEHSSIASCREWVGLIARLKTMVPNFQSLTRRIQ